MPLKKKRSKEDTQPEEPAPRVEISHEEMKTKFPHLYREMQEKSSAVPIQEVRKSEVEPQAGEKEKDRREKESFRDPLSRFEPGAIDFIRRASTEEEAGEVIDWLEKQGEITPPEADSLRNQLENNGLISFGDKKSPGYYHRYSREELAKTAMKKTPFKRKDSSSNSV